MTFINHNQPDKHTEVIKTAGQGDGMVRNRFQFKPKAFMHTQKKVSAQIILPSDQKGP